MTTQEVVAKRFVELCRTGKILQAQEELYHHNAVLDEKGIKPATTLENGKAGSLRHDQKMSSLIEEVHSNHISDPVVVGNFFSISWTMDATVKDKGRQHLEEICVYEVQEGKIIHEQFFF